MSTTIKSFELEQSILNCWSITDDLRVVSEKIFEDQKIDRDQAHTILNGIAALYEIKFEKCFNDFEKMLQEARR